MLLSCKWHLCLNLKKLFHHSLPLNILFFYNFNTIPLVAACWCFYPNAILYTAKQYKLTPVDKTGLFSSATGSRHQGGDAVNRNKQHLCQPDLWFKVPTWLISHTLSVKPFLSLFLSLSAKLMMLPHHTYTSWSPAISTLLTSCQQCSHSEGVQRDKLLVRSLWMFKEQLFTILCLIVTSIFKFSLSLFCMWKGSNHAFVYYVLARINPKALKIFNWIGE